MPTASHSCLPRCRVTLQETDAKIPPPVPGQQLLKKGEGTKQDEKSFWFKWKYHHHSPWKRETSGKLFSKNLCISVPGSLLATAVVWTIYKRITEAEEAGAAVCFRGTALRIHEDDYKFLFIRQFLQTGSFWHKDEKKKKAVKLMQSCLTHGNPSHSSQGLNAVQSMASLKRCYVSLSITTQTGSSTVGPMATVPTWAL